eukprot:3581242-Rhodomonas_salina.2
MLWFDDLEVSEGETAVLAGAAAVGQCGEAGGAADGDQGPAAAGGAGRALQRNRKPPHRQRPHPGP